MLFSSPRHSAECGVGFVSGYRESVAIREWTIRENATLGCVEKYSRWGLISRKQESAAVDASLRSLEMSTTSERRLGSLSGGNQQRALFTKLLLAQSQFAVLKEPTVGVDISARRALWLAIIRMAQSRAVVLASSDPEELLTLSDRIACFKKGRLVAVIPRSEASEQVIVEAIG